MACFNVTQAHNLLLGQCYVNKVIIRWGSNFVFYNLITAHLLPTCFKMYIYRLT